MVLAFWFALAAATINPLSSSTTRWPDALALAVFASASVLAATLATAAHLGW
jgi:hypothetical protein